MTFDNSEIEYILKPISAQDSVWQTIPKGLPALHFELQTGNSYDLFLRYKFQIETINHYLFTVKNHWWQTTIFKVTALLFCLSLISLLSFFYYQRNKKNKLAHQERETESTVLKLKAIRSQLNPHFIFNSLNSIQSLINTNQISEANRYLSEFSNLMRNTLTDSDKVFQTLNNEIKMLDIYLKLEQLRFEFEYSITTDKNINRNETEIPILLLQPLVENAVKHGVSELREKGKVNIHFYSDNSVLIAEIKDNGKGFMDEKKAGGYGLKLTHEKIQLLNKMLKGQSIEKKISHKNEETAVQIIFKNWL